MSSNYIYKKINRREFILKNLTAVSSLVVANSVFAAGSVKGQLQPMLKEADFSVFSKDNEMDLFLLIGQSNMKGRGMVNMSPKEDKKIIFFHRRQKSWYIARDPLHANGTPDLIEGNDNAGTGPGMSFAKTLRGKLHNNVGLVPAAAGGVKISLYGPDKPAFKRSVQSIELAQAKLPMPSKVKAILWLQGESDSTEPLCNSYEKKLHDMIANYRAVFKDSELPFIACTIGSFISNPRFSHVGEINTKLLSLPDFINHTACVDARDIEGHIGDRLHYSTEAQIEIGKRFAGEYMKMT